MASPYPTGKQGQRSHPASPIVGFNPQGNSQQHQASNHPHSSHPGSPVQNLHSSTSNSSLRNSLLSGNYGHHHQNKSSAGLSQHQSHPSLSSLAQQQQQHQSTNAPQALAYANAQLSNFAALQQTHQGSGDATANSQAAAFYAPPASSSTGMSTKLALSPQQQQQQQQAGISVSSSNNLPSNLVMSSPKTSRPLSTGSSTGAAAFAPQMTQLPPGLDLGALNIHSANSSAPPSAASSPGWSHRRLPSGSHHVVGGGPSHPTPHHNPRVAASSITGKRLNWGEMITATIAHSEHGRLVIQDLFEQMCQRFPEVQEWAFGKDWEGRVKNRIKSTLSIKGHLFVKVPRPSSASGKGSWWTLSQEAQEAFREDRLGPLLKLSSTGPGMTTPVSHSRNGSRNDALPGSNISNNASDSRYNSPVPSSGAATPVRHFTPAHPLTQQVDTTANDRGQQLQAQQAAQLARIQAHLLHQQQQQRDALPGSYDPNAPPSYSANLPPHFYNIEGMAGLSSPPKNSDGTASMDQQMYSSSMDRNLLQALQAYSSSFGGNDGSGNLQGAMDIDKSRGDQFKGSNNTSGQDTTMSTGSFGSNSFDATWRNLTMTGLGGDNSAPHLDWKHGRMSDPNVSDSVDSASASSNSGYATNATSGGRNTASSSSASASSYGIGSPQSMAHLGGPQSMPFPAQPIQHRPDMPFADTASPYGGDTNHSGSDNQSGSGSTVNDDGQTDSGGQPMSIPFDFAAGSGAPVPMGGTAGPGGMFPFAGGADSNGQPEQKPFDSSMSNGFGMGFRGFSNELSQFPGFDNSQMQPHNPFGLRLPGGYAMPIPDASNRGPHPWSQQQGNGGNLGNGNGQSGAGRPNADGSWSFSQGNNGLPPASPAGSFSAFFAYTPATGPIDAPSGTSQRGSREGSEAGSVSHHRTGSAGGGPGADAGGGESALGPMIGSRRRTSVAVGGPPGSRNESGGDSAYKYTSGQQGGTAQNAGGDANSTRQGPQLFKVEEGFALPPPATG